MARLICGFAFRFCTFILVFVLLHALAWAQVSTSSEGSPLSENHRPILSIELDPIPFLHHTRSAGAGVDLGSVRFSVHTIVENILSSPNGPRLRSGYVVQMQAFLRGIDEGWYAALQLGVTTVRKAIADGSKRFDKESLDIVPTVGYRQLISKDRHLYLTPAFGIGVVFRGRATHIAARPGLHLGYLFLTGEDR